MGKSLIITEKPSVAQEFAKVLGVSGGRRDGYLENQKYVITWCVGHLVAMVYPESYDIKYKKWKLEDLPFLPKEYKYDVIKDVSRQYDVVHGMLMREDIDRVYWAGDAGKEGQTIEENIRNSAVCETAWRNSGSGLIPRQRKRSNGESGKQNRCLPMKILENPVLCVPLKIMPWALIFPV